VPRLDDQDEKLTFIDRVQHPVIVSDTDAKYAPHAFECLDSSRARVIGELVDRGAYTLSH
jgi:hypothetical protein